MNAEQRFNKIEQHIEKLEQDRDSIIESEKTLLKLARLHRISLQELKAQLELDIGDVRERFDIIERRIDSVERRIDGIEHKIEEDITKVEIRMDSMESKIDQHGELLREILTRLPKPGE